MAFEKNYNVFGFIIFLNFTKTKNFNLKNLDTWKFTWILTLSIHHIKIFIYYLTLQFISHFTALLSPIPIYSLLYYFILYKTRQMQFFSYNFLSSCFNLFNFSRLIWIPTVVSSSSYALSYVAVFIVVEEVYINLRIMHVYVFL